MALPTVTKVKAVERPFLTLITQFFITIIPERLIDSIDLKLHGMKLY